MSKDFKSVPEAALAGSLRDFRAPEGADLMERVTGFYDWQDLRRSHDLWPYARSTSTAPQARCEAKSDAGTSFSGINFASQDYLSLSSHPAIKQAAIDAIGEYGVHSAGSAALLGNTANSLLLEQGLSSFLGGREIVLYPTGWSAGYGSVQGFVRGNDHVILDILAHSCLQEGAKAATQNIHYHGHLNLDALARKLERIRNTDQQNGILVVTESLFSMHSDTPDLAAMRALCDQYGATLLVDCAHDLGSIGDDGLGHLGLQNAMDSADIIIGSFSKTFGSNGGFIAVKTRAAAEYLKYYSATHTFSNALSPVQAATVLTALNIVRSEEGRTLRRKLMDNILYLRAELTRAGLETLGDPSPIVPVRLGLEGVGRFASRHLMALGGIANLVEYPAVPQGGARFRFQVMASHTQEDIDQVVKILAKAMRDADLEYRLGHEGQQDATRPATASSSAAA
ncbi:MULTISPECIES: pyridoxal phosphate-dependent aminotransferase family protein [Devosia]|jgi:7-keto-8-aminopelargonate synthetase-like enzyme|uniref:Pyridoxal phosphate-dependent aminotransferase family protein n=1 Tax=Devosia litorisediminis TaxID=2829817 RepID=A0A942E8L3_9HYPH|nr:MULTISPECIES: pyridoxal phosphate-dependent aminotransferase family protein [Devosia]MBS3847365.1 pyridoxal phosphate-dependent aminotransferase family protein [Devosia litorisediminis]MCZ4346737.1 pyridoxal phosphate-dependent aminotransferase family protein [Devosia neptuniae]|tara:strand:- start:24940 stop:26301 length:1362 start_codon:yes stop_codon:yes gene_type:complete